MPLKLLSPGGGSVLLQANTTGSDFTVNVPAVNGNMVTTADTGSITQGMLGAGVYAGYGPAFSAYIGTTQSVTSATLTKVQYDTEDFDTNNCYDTSNYRFTPNVAGYYQVNATVYIATNAAGSQCIFDIYKTGSSYIRQRLFYTSGSSTLYAMPSISGLVYCNGTTDYIEMYCSVTATTPSFANTGLNSRFSAALLRSA